jgi:hypothetical protein
MTKSNSPKRSGGISREQRSLRRNQILFAAMAIVVILSMVIAAVAQF